MSVMMTVLVLNVHHRGPINKEIPQWIRWLVLEKLRRLLCMKFPQSQSPQRNPTTAPNDSPLMWRFLLKTTKIDEGKDFSGMSTIAGPWMYQNGSAQVGKYSLYYHYF